MRIRKVLEFSAAGFDENLQGFGGDPYGGQSNVGIRIPALATPNPQSRYLVQLASFSLPEGRHAKIIGYRQLVTIGGVQTAGTPPYPIEFQVTTPMWHFVDGNISWHMRSLGSQPTAGIPSSVLTGAVPQPLDTFAYRFATSGSAMLYETAAIPPVAGNPGTLYVDLTAYTPPNQGRPWGKALRSGGNLSTFFGLQTTYETANAWRSLDIDVEGPDTFAFFASVYQSNPASRQVLTVPTTFYPGGVPPEELFLLNFPAGEGFNGVNYFRVGGSLIVEFPGD
jgi:hypothetical protein